MHKLVTLVGLTALVAGCTPGSVEYDPGADSLRFAGEVNLRNIRQLTFGGNNAEAYWSFDDESLVFQSDWSAINDQGCDQIFVMDPDAAALDYRLVSTGQGRTTCGYFMPDGRVLYASTHGEHPECPEPPAMQPGIYAWPIHDSYDIFVAKPDGTDPEILIGGPGYDAEATVSPDGRYVVFTSTRSGDLDLWRFDISTGDVLQLTDELGYDGGAFFSPDSKRIVWRASRPHGEAAGEYRRLLESGLVQPGALNLYTADVDGSSVRQVTDLPGANWAPFFHPSGEKIIFASNHDSPPAGRPIFSLYMIGVDGDGLVRITWSDTFDAFPMFSFDGTRLVFASNRTVDRAPSRDTNIFVADWVEHPEPADLEFGHR